MAFRFQVDLVTTRIFILANSTFELAQYTRVGSTYSEPARVYSARPFCITESWDCGLGWKGMFAFDYVNTWMPSR